MASPTRARRSERELGRGHDARARIRYHLGDFLAEQHAIEGHDHGVGAQDRVVRDDELRTVLHVERNPVAALHIAILLQKSGQEFGLARKLDRVLGQPLRAAQSGQRLSRISPRDAQDHAGGRAAAVATGPFPGWARKSTWLP